MLSCCAAARDSLAALRMNAPPGQRYGDAMWGGLHANVRPEERLLALPFVMQGAQANSMRSTDVLWCCCVYQDRRQSRRAAECCFVHWTESAQDSFCTDTYCITGDLSIVGWYLLEICDHLSIVGLQPEPAFHSTAGPLDVLLLSMTSVAKQQASSWPKPRRNTAEPHRLLIAEALLFQYLLST